MEHKNDTTEKAEASGSMQTNKTLERVIQTQNDEFSKIYKVFKQEYGILAEYKMVQEENIHGVYVIPSRETPLTWFGMIFVRSGPYKEGIFRFTIFLDENFPDSSHPRVVFHTSTFHPVIDPATNQLDLSKAFPTWSNKENHLWQVVKYIYWAFNNPEASLNYGIHQEACEMLSKNKADFLAKAKEIVSNTHSNLYNEPPTEDKHYFIFSPFDKEIHDKKKLTSILKSKEPNKKGYSWVMPRKFRPLERPESIDLPED